MLSTYLYLTQKHMCLVRLLGLSSTSNLVSKLFTSIKTNSVERVHRTLYKTYQTRRNSFDISIHQEVWYIRIQSHQKSCFFLRAVLLDRV